jgi:peptide/nickel transport system substrate-binding protein
MQAICGLKMTADNVEPLHRIHRGFTKCLQLFVFAWFLSLTVLACRPAIDSADDKTSSITILYPAEERLLGPVWDDTPKFLMFLPLVNYEQDAACGELTPALAERWEHSEDYRVWTLWLREDVSWHDGVPVTARDIKFTIDLLKHPDVLNYNAFAVDSVEILDEYTVRIFLTEPGRWPVGGWVTFYPRHLLAELDPGEFYEWEFWTHPVGNGPFRYVRHVPQTMMELEANPDYFEGKPRIERVILRFVAAGSGSGLLEMHSGNADLTSVLSLLEARQLAQDPRFRVHYRVSGSHASWLVYNPQHPLFQDVRVRRALTQAVDRRALHAVLDFPSNLPVTDGPYTICQFERREMAAPWPFDPAAAAHLLEEAGWRNERGDDIRERNGKEFRFTISVSVQDERAAVVLQDQFRRVGVHMEVQRLDGDLLAGRVKDGDFEATIPPQALMQQAMTSSQSPGTSSIFEEAYPGIVELLEAAPREPRFAERAEKFRQLAEKFRRELPATYLYPRVYPIVAHRKIRGFNHDGWTPPAWRWVFGGMEWLWLEDVQAGEAP